MLLILHAASALTALILAGICWFRPSKRLLGTASGLSVLAIVAGLGLVISTHAPLVQSCVAGLVYLAVAAVGLAVAYWRLRQSAQV